MLYCCYVLPCDGFPVDVMMFGDKIFIVHNLTCPYKHDFVLLKIYAF